MKLLRVLGVFFLTTIAAIGHNDDKTRLNLGIEFETQRVHRGSLRSQHSIQPQALLSRQFGKNCPYLGVKGYLPTKATHIFKNEIQISGGNSYRLTEFFFVDLGARYNWQPEKKAGQLGHSREVYFGVNTDILLSPSVYLFRDLERHQWAFETRFGYPFELDEFGLPNTTLESEFWAGIVKAKKPFGNTRPPEWNRKNKYTYFGTGLSLAFFLGENAKFKLGPRWSYNRDGNHPYSVANEHGHHSHLLWLAASFELRF